MMKTRDISGKWEKVKGNLKHKFAGLTDTDLMFAEGMKEEMFRRLQIKLGKTKEEMQKIIEAL
jgi:uncharacterized protein YjbJ (UPF0337 family)